MILSVLFRAAAKLMGKLKRSDNSLTQHMRLKHPDVWNSFKETRAKDIGDSKTNEDFEHDDAMDMIEVHKKRSLSTNYEDDTINY